MAAAQHVGHILVGSGQAVAHIHYHDDAVGSVNGDLGLLAHMGQNALGGLGLNAAGVHQQKFVAVPLAVGKDSVAGDARGIFHDGQTLAAQFVEQGRLAHVGAAHHCYDRFAHGGSSFLVARPSQSRLTPCQLSRKGELFDALRESSSDLALRERRHCAAMT